MRNIAMQCLVWNQCLPIKARLGVEASSRQSSMALLCESKLKQNVSGSRVLLLWKPTTDGALPQPFLNFVATKGTIWISGKALYGQVWVICQHMQAIKCVKFLVCKVGCKCKEVWHLWLCSTLRWIFWTFLTRSACLLEAAVLRWS